MDELYTFNSQQFQAISKRPSSTDNPPNIRKKIITSKFYKKQSFLSRASTQDENKPQNQSKYSPLKKVTFEADFPLAQDEVTNSIGTENLKKTRTFSQKQAQGNAVKANEGSRYEFEDTGNIKTYEPVKRSLSTAEGAVKQILVDKKQANLNKKMGTVRQKKILSLRHSPKIVPISQRKLPKAFKFDLEHNSLPRLYRKGKGIEENVNSAFSSISQKSEVENSIKADNISKLNKMLLVQAKFFEKLYRPGN